MSKYIIKICPKMNFFCLFFKSLVLKLTWKHAFLGLSWAKPLRCIQTLENVCEYNYRFWTVYKIRKLGTLFSRWSKWNCGVTVFNWNIINGWLYRKYAKKRQKKSSVTRCYWVSRKLTIPLPYIFSKIFV